MFEQRGLKRSSVDRHRAADSRHAARLHIRRAREAGVHTMADVARELNRKRVRPPHGRSWTAASVAKFLLVRHHPSSSG